MISAIIKKISNIAQFYLLSAVLLTVLTVALIWVSDVTVRQSFMTRVRNSTARNIQMEAKTLLTADDFTYRDPDHTKDIFSALFQRIRTTEIFRIKVWDSDARVIFSDDESIVGKRFTDDPELQNALTGVVSSRFGSPDKQVAEVYVPITFGSSSRPVGVIETYFDLVNISNQISQTLKILLITILSFVSASFLMLVVLSKKVVFSPTEFMRTVINTNPGLIFVKDWNGRFTMVNQATADIYNTTIENLLGKTDADFNPNKEEVKNFLAADRRVMESGRPSPVIEEPVTNIKTREQRWFQTIKVPITVGGIKQVLGVSTEITLRKKNEEQMRLQTAALDAADNTVIITDREGIIQWVNPAFTRLTGYTAEDAIGKTPRILKSGKENRDYYKRQWDTIIAGRSWREEIVDRRKDGSLYTVDQAIAPVKDVNGNITNFVAVQQDITQRVLVKDRLADSQKAIVNVLEDLRLEKAKDEAMLLSIGDGVIAVDTSGKIIMMNKVSEELLGWKIEEAIGKHYNNIVSLIDEKGTVIPPEDRPLTKALSSSSSSSSSSTTSLYLLSKNKIKLPVAIAISPIILNNKIIGAIEVFRDITREKEIDRAKTEFVSLASHQLRTPLSTINWYTEMLLAGDAGAIGEKQKEYLNEVYGGSKRMVDLVNSLLNVSRIETGSFGIEPKNVVIKDVVDGVLADLASDLTQKNIHVATTYGDVVSVTADPKLLRIMLQNLLTNAERYTPPEGSIRLQVTRRPGDILFTVSDTGIGIPSGAQDKIFTKLYRADNARMAQPNGNGLGLYMVKNILDATGGRIWFESTEEKGSTFYVTIPLSGMKQKAGTKTLT
jgi:PAS domain S-box-containing protein